MSGHFSGGSLYCVLTLGIGGKITRASQAVISATHSSHIPIPGMHFSSLPLRLSVCFACTRQFVIHCLTSREREPSLYLGPALLVWHSRSRIVIYGFARDRGRLINFLRPERRDAGFLKQFFCSARRLCPRYRSLSGADSARARPRVRCASRRRSRSIGIMRLVDSAEFGL